MFHKDVEREGRRSVASPPHQGNKNTTDRRFLPQWEGVHTIFPNTPSSSPPPSSHPHCHLQLPALSCPPSRNISCTLKNIKIKGLPSKLCQK